jgi:tetratricopeptide (TPR) repeat protein
MVFSLINSIPVNRNVILITVACFMSVIPQSLRARVCDAPVATAHSVQGQVELQSKDASSWVSVKLDDVFCPGDQIHVGQNSRASLLFNDETLLRLAENSVVSFSAPQVDGSSWLNLLEGAAHFISRIYHSFQVATPYVNAYVEGTEFTVEVAPDRAAVTVLEGRVEALNEFGEVTLTSGQKAVALANRAPQIERVVDPLDAVKWTLYYPPLIEDDTVTDRQSREVHHRGDPQGAIAALSQRAGIEADPAILVYRASLQLQVGGEDAARRDLEQALRLEPNQADALALLSIIASVQNQRLKALELAQRGVEVAPQNLATLLALSYAQQARFRLHEALDAAQRATEAAPESALAWSQLARLHLMFRHLDEATEAARRAVAIAPERSQSHTTLGFVRLTSINIDGARQAFEQAIRLDRMAAPLPRFGLGLVEIRKGRLAEGRRQLEIAATLDPGSAMIRSYLGKAYYEEKRNSLAVTQFELAKQFDENDPTAWFYNAILQQSQNRPVDALNELQGAIDLNDNRAVYRSRFLLDQDEAARDASQARVYQDLGFEKQARSEAYKSLQISSHNHSAHRFLADSYSGDSLLDTARMSELLQSQLLQPLNSNPIQPQLGVSKLGILDGAGPSDVGYAEYTPLFTRNGLNLQLNAIGGSDDTGGDDLILSGLRDRVAFSLGQFHYETEGWRENNDQKHDIYNAFLQVALTPTSSVQFEYRRQDKESGDLDLTFEPEDVDPYERNRLSKRISRIGLHHELASNGHLIASVIAQEVLDIKEWLHKPIFRTAEETGTYPSVVDHTGRSSIDSESSLVELQIIQPFNEHAVILGAGYFRDDRALLREEWNVHYYATPGGVVVIPATLDPLSENHDPKFKNLYLYTQLGLPARVNLTLGASYEDFEVSYTAVDRTSPKFGLTWEARDNLSFRAAYMESVVRPFYLDQTIEPTQVAGFNQLFFVGQGAELEQFGFGVDAKLNSSMAVGAEFTHEDIQVYWRNLNEDFDDFYDIIEHELSHAYIHWTASDMLGLRIAYEYDNFSGTLSPQVLKTKRLPIGINYYWPSGLFLKAEGIYVDQKITRRGNQHDRDDFWNVDIVTGYRFPKRYGKVELVIKNLLDENFNYYDAGYSMDEMASPQYWPERQLFVRFSLNF